MLVYRVQDRHGKGMYSVDGLSFIGMGWGNSQPGPDGDVGIRDFWNRLDRMYRWGDAKMGQKYNSTTGMYDPIPPVNPDDKQDSRNYRFGFRDLNQLKRWINPNIDGRREFQNANNHIGLHVAVVEVSPNESVMGECQAIYYHASAKVIERLDLVNFKPMEITNA